jgi:N-6 DNA Methylase/Eco57I restriction-modification methylase
MLPGLSGALLSHSFREHLLTISFKGELGEASAPAAQARYTSWWRTDGAHLGPASSLRAIREGACMPLADILGFDPHNGTVIGPDVSFTSGGWNDNLDALWRSAVRTAIGAETRWCLCTNGHQLRLVDAQRTYSRAYLQVDLERAADDPRVFAVLWGLFRAEAFRRGDTALIARAIQSSARHGAAVSRALRFGVVEAVGNLLSGLLTARSRRYVSRSDETLAAGFAESLTLVYRVLFLMFAEARGLVPNWHPIYRDHYTIESLRDGAEQPGNARGLWETLQAIARLAHQGCQVGTLVVPAFNGRLFSPSRAPLAEACAMSDEAARTALLALSSTALEKRGGRVRIDYRDLGVEQLGAVYESVLDYVPAFAESALAGPPRIQLRRGGDQRKTTGSFYTPQSITDYLVRRTLHPLVDAASADDILQLRVLDPAMGSAAFLVAACRYLARAYERALVRDGGYHDTDFDDVDRAGFRRLVAQRCLYGVDLNPTAVQLARLSLWLATLSADKPLTFLDHHLAVGDSLIGASLIDLARRPPPGTGRGARPVDAPLFSDSDLEPSLGQVVCERDWIAGTPDDALETVREKERRLERLAGTRRWKTLADLWCACWMWPDRTTAPHRAVYASLTDLIVGANSALPPLLADRLLSIARSTAETRRFFHWTLEFPEIYFDNAGQPLARPGFDAVIGNPPWDMLRADGSESSNARDDARSDNVLIKRFVRESGIYRFQGPGHLNRYQLFVERAMMLVRKGGRLGLVLPSGIATDHGSSRLRQRLLDQHDLDALVGFDNRQAIFPIHRSVRFVLCTATSGAPTTQIHCRFGITEPTVLDTVPDHGGSPDVYPVRLTPSLIARLGGAQMTIPELRTSIDLRIVERIGHAFPRMSDAEGWGATFGRELNATDDRPHFHKDGAGLPVLEGKHIEPFRAHPDRSRNRMLESAAGARLGTLGSFRRARLAYRDVASVTNRVSLIAAVIPPDVVTTHSLFCLKTPLNSNEQAFLCGILNSYVANYLVRQVMTTHLGSTTVEQLRVPKPPKQAQLFKEIVDLSRQLARQPSSRNMARLQAAAARAYRLTAGDFQHVLATFPLIPESERAAALDEFNRESSDG